MKSEREIEKDIKETGYVKDMFPIISVLDDGITLVTKDLRLVQTVKLAGVDYTGMDSEDRASLWKVRESFFSSLNTEVRLSIHVVREEKENEEPAYHLGNKYAEAILDKRQDLFKKSYETNVYLVFSLPVGDSFTKTGIMSLDGHSELYKILQKRDVLRDEVVKQNAIISRFEPKLLEFKGDKDQGLLKFWSYYINGDDTGLIPNQREYLNHIIPSSVLSFTSLKNNKLIKDVERSLKTKKLESSFIAGVLDKITNHNGKQSAPYIIFENNQTKRYAAILRIAKYPSEHEEGVFDSLYGIDHSFSMVQHLKKLKSDDEKFLLELANKKAKDKNSDFEAHKIGETTQIGRALESGLFELFAHAYEIIVYGSTPEEVESGIGKISQLMARQSINIVREKVHTQAAFWGIFPGYEEFLSPRTKKVTTPAVTNFVSFGMQSNGHQRCSFGAAPVANFMTNNNQKYSFIFHANEEKYSPGHTMIIGKTGSGKSVLINLLMACLLKYEGSTNQGALKMMVFDSNNGLKIPTNAFDGEYIDFSKTAPPLNPMQLADTQENRRFLETFLGKLYNARNEDDEEVIHRIVTSNYEDLKFEDRQLWNLLNTMTLKGKRRLAKWLPSDDNPNYSEYPTGMLFNAPTDALQFDKRIVTFDMSTYFQDPEIMGALSPYIFHRFIEYAFNNPMPHAIIIDEMINYLKIDYFNDLIDKGLREFRKNDGILISAIQDLRYLYDTKNAEKFIGQTETFIIFPNSAADPHDYMGGNNKSGIGLTESEFYWVKHTPTHEHKFMVKRKDGATVILRNDLSCIGDLLYLLSGNREVVSYFDYLQTLSPEDLKEQGFDDWQQALMNKFSRG